MGIDKDLDKNLDNPDVDKPAEAPVEFPDAGDTREASGGKVRAVMGGIDDEETPAAMRQRERERTFAREAEPRIESVDDVTDLASAVSYARQDINENGNKLGRNIRDLQRDLAQKGFDLKDVFREMDINEHSDMYIRLRKIMHNKMASGHGVEDAVLIMKLLKVTPIDGMFYAKKTDHKIGFSGMEDMTLLKRTVERINYMLEPSTGFVSDRNLDTIISLLESIHGSGVNLKEELGDDLSHKVAMKLMRMVRLEQAKWNAFTNRLREIDFVW